MSKLTRGLQENIMALVWALAAAGAAYVELATWIQGAFATCAVYCFLQSMAFGGMEMKMSKLYIKGVTVEAAKSQNK